MTIIDKLKDSIEFATGLPFVYGAQGDVNRALDNVQMPCAYAYLAESGMVTDENGIIRERLTMVVFFCNLTEFDFESLENEQILDDLKKRAFRWVASLRKNWNGLQLVSLNGTSRVYEEFDAIVTAYALNVTLDELDGVSGCDAPIIRHWDFNRNGQISLHFDFVGVQFRADSPAITFDDGFRFAGMFRLIPNAETRFSLPQDGKLKVYIGGATAATRLTLDGEEKQIHAGNGVYVFEIAKGEHVLAGAGLIDPHIYALTLEF